MLSIAKEDFPRPGLEGRKRIMSEGSINAREISLGDDFGDAGDDGRQVSLGIVEIRVL
jgi:hypothetical protein